MAQYEWLGKPHPKAKLSWEQLAERIERLLSTQNMCVMATVGQDGAVATPVEYYADGLTLYLHSQAGSPKSKNIERDPRVSVGILLRSSAGRARAEPNSSAESSRSIPARPSTRPPWRSIAGSRGRCNWAGPSISLRRFLCSSWLPIASSIRSIGSARRDSRRARYGDGRPPSRPASVASAAGRYVDGGSEPLHAAHYVQHLAADVGGVLR